ncbi:phage holin family protein [Actinotalea sp. BY-33]|uniref:Phage holin family protein n=1 Tax=Actinotalea soli TaxID=2819234 RepID=A0A939RT13_9CELL|nr:phage holin family protein [Actinotalea soli]MBO1753172.1 phage holin family protein [Actinotalea soli]
MTSTNSTGRADARPSIGELVQNLTEKLSQLIRDEIALAKAEMTEKAKHAGIGVGLLVGAGLLGFFALATLIATAVLGLANAVPAWLAALIVAVVLLAIAATLALIGIKTLKKGVPPVPERAQESVKLDVEAVKEGLQ